jgi:hypothetical protein
MPHTRVPSDSATIACLGSIPGLQSHLFFLCRQQQSISQDTKPITIARAYFKEK